MDIFRC